MGAPNDSPKMSPWSATFMADALAIAIPTDPVPAEQVTEGHPETGSVPLTEWDDRDVGVWVMTPGAMTDVETDEICIIIAGVGVVHRTLNGVRVEQALTPGAVFQLLDDEETVWVVSETVRKIYLA
jgi:uncharacterized cupin superfamily protein